MRPRADRPTREQTPSGRERLILQYLPLVRSVARSYAQDGAELDDLVQVGTIGLIKAIDRFDARRGVDLAAYARPTVAGEIRRHLRDAVPAVRPPRRLHELNGRLRRLRRELAGPLGRPATTRELARAAGASEAEANAAVVLERSRYTVPLSNAEPRSDDPFGETDDRLLVASCLDRLDERERRIVKLRFYAGLSQREIGREVGLSQVHVSRLLDSSMRVLRKELERPPKRVSRIVVPVAKS